VRPRQQAAGGREKGRARAGIAVLRDLAHERDGFRQRGRRRAGVGALGIAVTLQTREEKQEAALAVRLALQLAPQRGIDQGFELRLHPFPVRQRAVVRE